MKKLVLFFFAFLFVISLVSCKDTNDDKKGFDYDAIPDTMEADSYEIGFVTDIGQLKDKSFNQGTWDGIKRYGHENAKTYKYYQPANSNEATDEDRYNAMRMAVDNGAKIVVCAGFMQVGALERAIIDFPNVKFVFIDGWALGSDNLAAVVFKEEQSGYFAGYAAVMEGYTKLGFTGGGGGTNPACQRFGYGYIQGANAAAKEKNITVSMKYSWLYGDAFQASTDLQTQLNGWYSTGTQVVFSCGGTMCNSAFAAADENGGHVIGVDVDQSSQSDTVITSATKGLREASMYVLDKFFNNKWEDVAGETINLGVEDDAVGLPTQSWSMKNFTVEQYNELFQKVKDGKVLIDSNPDGAETKTYTNVNLEYIK